LIQGSTFCAQSLISLEIQGIFVPPSRPAADLILLEQKNGGMSRKGHVNAMP
jgi:hypothetical protein